MGPSSSWKCRACLGTVVVSTQRRAWGPGEGRAPFRPRPGGGEAAPGSLAPVGSPGRQDRVPLDESASEEAGRWQAGPGTQGRATAGGHIASEPLLLYRQIIQTFPGDFSQRFVFVKSSCCKAQWACHLAPLPSAVCVLSRCLWAPTSKLSPWLTQCRNPGF